MSSQSFAVPRIGSIGGTRGAPRVVVGALAAVLAAVSCPSGAAEKTVSELRTDSAYFKVYSYHCAPTFFDSIAREHPDGMAVAVLEARFSRDFQGYCRAFYLAEIEPRLDLTVYGVIAMKTR
jgi:hypothetical protein